MAGSLLRGGASHGGYWIIDGLFDFQIQVRKGLKGRAGFNTFFVVVIVMEHVE